MRKESVLAVLDQMVDEKFNQDDLRILREILIAHERTTHACIEEAPLAIVITDRDGVIAGVNARTERMFGYAGGELLGANLDLLVPRILHQGRIQSPQELTQGPDVQPIQDGIELVGYCKDGSQFPVEVNFGFPTLGSITQVISYITDISERRRALEALSQVKNHLNAAQQQAQMGSWEWAPETQQVWWSDGLFTLFGLAADEQQPSLEAFFNLIHPDDRDEVLNSFQEASNEIEKLIAGDPAFLNSFRIVRPDGEIRWVQSRSANQMFNGDQMVVHGYIQDITSQISTEEELRKFSRAVEQSASAVIITNFNGTIDYVNPKFTQMSGYSLDEIRGQRPGILRSGETPAHEYQHLWQVISTGGEWKGEFHNRRKNGELYWVSASISPIRNSQGVTTHFLGIQEDITERKLTEEKLRRQNAYLAALHETSLGVISRLDLEDLLHSLITRAGQLLDTPHGFIFLVDEGNNELECKIGLGAFHNFTGDRFPPGEGCGGIVWQSQEPLIIEDYLSWQGRSDRFSPPTIQSVSGVPLISGSQVIGVLGLAYDHDSNKVFGDSEVELLNRFGQLASISIDNARLFSDAQRARAAAEKANRVKSDFLANVSHELRTPLTAIHGFAHLARKRLNKRISPLLSADDHEAQSTLAKLDTNLEIIIAESLRLTAMINNVLDLEKIEAGKVVWAQQPVEMSAVINQAAATVEPMLLEKDLELALDLPPRLPYITGDREKLLQVMLNLFSNALKFSRSGTVTCCAESSSSDIFISVSDQGIGIPHSDLESVFEQFKQLDDTQSAKPVGSGLGLFICREIIEHHGGRIWAESEPGNGSTFSFSLPLTG